MNGRSLLETKSPTVELATPAGSVQPVNDVSLTPSVHARIAGGFSET
jgi:hypothetical protein